MATYRKSYWIKIFLVFHLLVLQPIYSAEKDIQESNSAYTSVITPNGATLPHEVKDGVKVFHLTAEKIQREFTSGFMVDCWGYNGQTPGPTIEAVEGDRVRILVTNKAPEPTSVHWHGLFLPNGMDGVAGLTQRYIEPGETYAYEFNLVQHGTFMYHPHADEAVQIAMGMEGFFVIHPKERKRPKVDRDYAVFLHMWQIKPGTSKPNPNAMLDFNYFSFNSRVYPGTSPLIAQRGERVRIRFANLSMESHPIHIHGVSFKVTATEGGDIPESAQIPTTTVNVPPGTVKIIEFVPEYPGDWPMHCHKTHHAMNAMEHHIPNMIGVAQGRVENKIRELLPGYMAMGERGMHDMQEHSNHMPAPKNTPPMMAGDGPFGNISMGGMFTILKVREKLEGNDDPGWYTHPPGTVASQVNTVLDPKNYKENLGEDGNPGPRIDRDRLNVDEANTERVDTMPETPEIQGRPDTKRHEKSENEKSIDLPGRSASKRPEATPRNSTPLAKTRAIDGSPSGKNQSSLPPILIVDDFDYGSRQNALGNSVGVYKQAPSKVTPRIVKDTIDGRSTNALRLRFRKAVERSHRGRSRNGSCGYFSILKDPAKGLFLNATDYRFLTMWVKGQQGNENFVVKLTDKENEKSEASVTSGPISRYLSTPRLGTEWTKLRIPLRDFSLDRSQLSVLYIGFESSCFPDTGGGSNGFLYIDDIRFEGT